MFETSERGKKNEVITLQRSELQQGLLYRIGGTENPNDFTEYNTLYTKLQNGQILWFEPDEDRMGVEDGADNDDVFILAPKGTYFTIKNT